MKKGEEAKETQIQANDGKNDGKKQKDVKEKVLEVNTIEKEKLAGKTSTEIKKEENKNQSQETSQVTSQETKENRSNNPEDNDKNEEDEEDEENAKGEEKKNTDEVMYKTDAVYVERIINVEISKEVRNFINTFIERREEILNWCNKNAQAYTDKINEKTATIFFHDTKNLNRILNEGSMNIDLLSIIIYFYNLYCTHNNKEKVNFNDLMTNSHITYRGLYENIDKNSRTFKNLLQEEKKYKLKSEKKNSASEDSFWNYRKTYSYGMNLILGIFLTFLSGYYGALLLGYKEFTTRLIYGIIFSYVGLIMEVFIYIIINEKSENIKKKRQKALSRYSGLYKKIHVSSDKRGESSVAGFLSGSTISSNLSTGLNSSTSAGLNLEETKKDK